MIPGKTNCVICHRYHSHENRYIFPEDFPDEFKMCCFCKVDAELVGKFGLEFIIGNIIAYPKGYLDGKSYMRKLRKINKLITIG